MKRLLIVFVKGGGPGSVKTRLAAEIGNEVAYSIYQRLVLLTEEVTNEVEVDKWILFSGEMGNSFWPNAIKYRQEGMDLGEKMQNAFKRGFENGYDEIVLIGSDLPDLSKKVIEKAFNQLSKSEVVFGPARDGGYYLIGLTKLHHFIFENKPWSKSQLLTETIEDLQKRNVDYAFLQELNDIDTYEDYINSSLFGKINLKNSNND